jgi:hypothetical protein
MWSYISTIKIALRQARRNILLTRIFDMKIPFIFDADIFDMGKKLSIGIDFERHPMFLVVGGTGSGKTYFQKLLLGKISKYLPTAKVTICDYKNCDFTDFAGLSRHYAFEDCSIGLQNFYDEFLARKNGGQPRILLFDEWGAYVLSRHDKKQADEAKAKLSTLLMLGRSARFHVVIGLQRADSEHFKSGARDQFGAILGLGNLSKEQKLMLYNEHREEMTANCGRGQGYLLLDGEGLYRIRVPTVNDMDKLNAAIADALSR